MSCCWCPAGPAAGFNAPLEAFLPLLPIRCPFSSHWRAKYDWLGLIWSRKLPRNQLCGVAAALSHHCIAHRLCLTWIFQRWTNGRKKDTMCHVWPCCSTELTRMSGFITGPSQFLFPIYCDWICCFTFLQSKILPLHLVWLQLIEIQKCEKNKPQSQRKAKKKK